MRIGVCQTPEILGNVDAAVEVVRHFAERAVAEEVDLLVFPECFLQAFRWQDRHREIRARRTRESGMWLASADVTGARDNERSSPTSRGRVADRLIAGS
ncbi:hypothetical protein [Actinoplanes sp. NPDC051494]|uniref:hypothetical protein n=1 Tax=Actinoplanes sp. NPDC051494 TaxID=3363907 RepID=UPI00379FC670